MHLREGETVGEYVVRLEARLRELEPPDGFTVQEWHVGQVYSYLLWRDKNVRDADDVDALKAWSDRIAMFEDRFPEQVKKFAGYMGWNEVVRPQPIAKD